MSHKSKNPKEKSLTDRGKYLAASLIGLSIILSAFLIGWNIGEPEDNPSTPTGDYGSVPYPNAKPSAGRQEIKIGESGKDGNLVFEVIGVRALTEDQFPRDEYALGEEFATPEQKWVVVNMKVTNEGTKPTTPFCGSLGITLVTEPFANYNSSSSSLDYPNNNYCEEIAPGFSKNVISSFLIPSDRTWTKISVWDHEEPGDPSGDTYLTFVR